MVVYYWNWRGGQVRKEIKERKERRERKGSKETQSRKGHPACQNSANSKIIASPYFFGGTVMRYQRNTVNFAENERLPTKSSYNIPQLLLNIGMPQSPPGVLLKYI